jgi:predicted lactoylglutathione lyase
MLTIALPTADRMTTYRFYQEVLGLSAPGDLADDGVPEPLQFVVNDGTRLMFIPPGGFGWVTGDHETAAPGVSECLLSLTVETDAEVDAVVAKAGAAGARIVGEPEQKPWGYLGTFSDPDGHLWEVINPTG